jgi:hypothetical protein
MTNTPLSDAQMRARAIARWEGEGGALSPPNGSEAIDEASLRILARLGAALLDEWSSIPANAQSELLRRARTLGSATDHARIRDALSRFLKEHRDEC